VAKSGFKSFNIVAGRKPGNGIVPLGMSGIVVSRMRINFIPAWN
jgi:hypothetical protein